MFYDAGNSLSLSLKGARPFAMPLTLPPLTTPPPTPYPQMPTNCAMRECCIPINRLKKACAYL